MSAMMKCPRCGEPCPTVHVIRNPDGSIAERACEPCVFDDVHAGRVALRRRKSVSKGGAGIPAKPKRRRP